MTKSPSVSGGSRGGSMGSMENTMRKRTTYTTPTLELTCVNSIIKSNFAIRLISCIKNSNVCMAYVQCYDGSSNMAGPRSGCRSIIQQQAPMAIYSTVPHINSILQLCQLVRFRLS